MKYLRQLFNFIFRVADKSSEVVEAVAPVAEAVAPLCGKYGVAVSAGAKLAEELAPVVEGLAEKAVKK